MKQFIQGSDTAFVGLAQRIVGNCCVYRDQEMPPGSHPSHSRIGFEQCGRGGVRLLVDKGVLYAGSSGEIRTWLADGQKDFASMSALRSWLRDTMAPSYSMEPVVQSQTESTISGALSQMPQRTSTATRCVPAGEMTDLSAVREHLAQRAHIVPMLDADQLYAFLTAHVRGQDSAMRSLARHTGMHVAKTHPNRPATFFAVGPTGVGKTSSVHTLRDALRESLPEENRCGWLRLDMSEYAEAHRVSQLVGSPQGYVGYGEGAALVDQLTSRPQSIILFDEIEKAHPAVLRFLMNAIDAGRLSRAQGRAGSDREVNCRQAIFFFTSNLACQPILDELGVDPDNSTVTEQRINAVCRRHLLTAGILPEVLGRIGSFLAFRPLSEGTRAEIVALSVQKVARQYGVSVSQIAPEAVVELLAASGGSDFGARPVEQVIEERLGMAFAKAAREHPDKSICMVGADLGVFLECHRALGGISQTGAHIKTSE